MMKTVQCSRPVTKHLKRKYYARRVHVPPAMATSVINPSPRIPCVSPKTTTLPTAALLDCEPDEPEVEDAVEPEPEPAGAVGVKVACALDRQEVAAGPTADEGGGLETTVALPEKSQD